VLKDEDPGDEVTGKDKEDVNADEPAWQSGSGCMEDKHEQDRDTTQPIEVGAIVERAFGHGWSAWIVACI
jgi:hypothetical protein